MLKCSKFVSIGILKCKEKSGMLLNVSEKFILSEIYEFDAEL